MTTVIAAVLSALAAIAVAAPAQASQWQRTAQSADGLAQQYVDLDSLRGEGAVWTVKSYFSERKRDASGEWVQSRADYLTQYDCDRHRYRDLDEDLAPALVPNGSTLESQEASWGDALADPLNRATMDYVCDHLPLQ